MSRGTLVSGKRSARSTSDVGLGACAESSWPVPTQLDLFAGTGEAGGSVPWSLSRISGTVFGRAGTSRITSGAYERALRRRGISFGTSGYLNSPSEAGRTIMSSGGSPVGTSSEKRMVAGIGGLAPRARKLRASRSDT